MTNDRRLIEDSLPLEAIREQSALEKTIRHGHISTLHTWWARRSLALVNPAIFASLLPAPKSEEERSEVLTLVADVVNWDALSHENHPRVEKARELIREYYGHKLPKILDPFLGGGSIALEALRLGCETYGVELNPVAVLINLCTLDYPQRYGKSLLTEIEQWGTWLLDTCADETNSIYSGGDDVSETNYWWIPTVNCPNLDCGKEAPLVHDWWLSKRTNHAVIVQPVVDNAHGQVKYQIITNPPQSLIQEGTVHRGKATCLHCGHSFDLADIQSSSFVDHIAVVIERRNSSPDPTYRVATDADRDVFELAKQTLRNKLEQNPLLVPNEPLPGVFSASLSRYGLSSWNELFNPRQLFALAMAVEKVQSAFNQILAETNDTERARAIVAYLGLLVDKLAEKCSVLCGWESRTRTIRHVYTRRALFPQWGYAECNPFRTAIGKTALGQILSAVETCCEISSRAANVVQGDAAHLSYEDQSMDLVILDLPYYDSVQYAALADFYYVWLKRSVGSIYPELFQWPLSPKEAEITSGSDGRGSERYEQLSRNVYLETWRVLNDAGCCILVAPLRPDDQDKHGQSPDAEINIQELSFDTENLIKRLVEAQLVPTATWAIQSEHPGLKQAYTLPSTALIFCRKRHIEFERGEFIRVRAKIRDRVRKRLEALTSAQTRQEDIRFDLFIACIGPALEVFASYRVITHDDSVLGVDDVLDIVRDEVLDYALALGN